MTLLPACSPLPILQEIPTLLALGPTTGTGLSESIYYAKNIVGSNTNTVTVTFNQGATKPDVRILEYSGVATSNPLDVSTGASGNSNIADSGFVTTNAANELIVGANMVSSNTTIMAGAPATIRIITSPNSDLAADQLVNVPGSYHSWAPLNASGPWVSQVVTFRAANTSTVPFVSSVSPSSGPTSGGTAVTITGTNFAGGATVTLRQRGGDERGGGEQHDHHGDDAGGERGCGDGDGDGERAERQPGERVHLRGAADGEQRESEQRVDIGRYGGDHHGNQLRRRGDGEVRQRGGEPT